MSLSELITELDDELNGRKGLFNRHVDLNRCAELFNQIKQMLPNALNEAETVIKSRERILENADMVARNIIKEAEERATHLSENSEIVKSAEKQGREILDKAYRDCDTLIQKTKEHLDSMFGDADTFFRATLDTIQTNRNELRGALIKTEKK